MHFKIGEQYEKQEFNLQRINTILLRDLEYEVYRYINREPITLFNVGIKRIILYYNADILSAVYYQFKDRIDTSFKAVKNNEAKLIIDGADLWVISKYFCYKELL